MNYFILQNIYGIWTTCNACTNLFYQYIPESYKTTFPLLLTGFDSQQYLDYSFHNLKDKLDSVLRRKDLPITHESFYPEALRLIDSSKKWDFILPKNNSNISVCLNYLQTIKKQLSASDNADDFWILVVDNLIQQVNGVKYKLGTGKQASDERDIQMAKNLAWLISHRYKDKKIIVWAASRHIARSLKNLSDHQLHSAESMGDQLVTMLPVNEPVYILGFTSFQGTGGRIGTDPYKVYTRFKNSFEGWLNEKNYKYAFVDFADYNKLHPYADENFKMAALGHSTIDGRWNRVFDGIFYIRDTYACTRMEKYPSVK